MMSLKKRQWKKPKDKFIKIQDVNPAKIAGFFIVGICIFL
jgi:hypothetical protein